MKEHDSHFDEKLSKIARNEACGLRPDAGMKKSKIDKGSSLVGKQKLSQELQDKIDKKWAKVVHPITNCSTYEELRMKFNMDRAKS